MRTQEAGLVSILNPLRSHTPTCPTAKIGGPGDPMGLFADPKPVPYHGTDGVRPRVLGKTLHVRSAPGSRSGIGPALSPGEGARPGAPQQEAGRRAARDGNPPCGPVPRPSDPVYPAAPAAASRENPHAGPAPRRHRPPPVRADTSPSGRDGVNCRPCLPLVAAQVGRRAQVRVLPNCQRGVSAGCFVTGSAETAGT